MVKAILYDGSRCIGCRACQVACKRWNELDAEKTSLSQTWTNPPDLSANTWNIIKISHLGKDSSFKMHFATYRCMHCLEPVCVKVCPPRAIVKDPETGAVVIHSERCVGCLLCVEACPFKVPKFGRGVGTRKCTLCFDRLKVGLKPACVQSCPTEALKFGDREEIVEEAKRRAAEVKGYLYGVEEAGGTGVIMVLTAPPEELGLPAVAKKVYEVPEVIPVKTAAAMIQPSLSSESLRMMAAGGLAILGLGIVAAIAARRRSRAGEVEKKEI
jgi:formate dehydrogenase iron-sulfur subunit